MDTTSDLKLLGVALVNGQPLACGECGNTFSLEVHKHLVFETASAWISCPACGHGEESPAVTTGLVDAVLAGWLTRRADAERDVFTAEWRGIVLTGELYPTLDVHQFVGAARAVHEYAAPEVKSWWRAKKKAAKARVKGRADAVTDAVKGKVHDAADAAKGKAGEAIGTVKATALTAAWTLQTGGAGPTTSTRARRRRCTVKGCRGGMLTISTRIHSTTGKTQTAKVPCAVCRRTGGGK